MTIKITALLTSVCAAGLYLLSLRFPNDPFFFFISSNFGVGVLRMLLAGSLLHLAVRPKFNNRHAHRFYATTAIALTAFGVAGLIIAPLDYELFNYVKPLDLVYCMLIGSFYGLAALSYERGTRRLPRLSRPRSTQPRLLARRA